MLNVSRMQKARSDWITSHAKACCAVTCPDGIGRDLVRATAASKSRSVMSFQVQPAPRIRKAPMAQPRTIQRSKRFRPAGSAAAASITPHQHGSRRSHVPMGRSARLSLR
jgi:hypothetical protein